MRHGKPDDLLRGADLEPYRTTWDALGDLPERLNDPALKLGGKWAGAAAEHSRGRELSLAHGARRRHAAVRLAHALLELPAEAGQGSSVVDDPGATGTGNRTFPLDQPASFVTRAVPSPDVSQTACSSTAVATTCSACSATRCHHSSPRSSLARSGGSSLAQPNESEKAAALAASARSLMPQPERVAKVPSIYHVSRRRPRRASGRGIGEQGKAEGGGVESGASDQHCPQRRQAAKALSATKQSVLETA